MIASLVTVTMVLVLVLFVIDRWYSVLQWGAVNRARAIELILSLDTTREIQRWAQREGLWKVVALIQYGSFVVVSLGLGVAVLGWDAVPSPTHGAANLMAGAAVICLVLIVVVHITANREWEKLMGDPPSPARGIVTHSIRLTREGVKANDTADYVVAVSPALSQAARALAVVKPSDQPGLSIVGCEVLPPDRVKVTLANSQPAPIIPSDEDLQLITYF